MVNATSCWTSANWPRKPRFVAPAGTTRGWSLRQRPSAPSLFEEFSPGRGDREGHPLCVGHMGRAEEHDDEAATTETQWTALGAVAAPCAGPHGFRQSRRKERDLSDRRVRPRHWLRAGRSHHGPVSTTNATARQPRSSSRRRNLKAAMLWLTHAGASRHQRIRVAKVLESFGDRQRSRARDRRTG
jgi:hypothetical protein